MHRTPIINALFVLVTALVGCNAAVNLGEGATNLATAVGSSAVYAEEERTFTAPHMAGSAVEVHNPIGSVNVTADPSLKEVRVTATVKVGAMTEEEARAVIELVHVTLERPAEGPLKLVCEHPEPKRGIQINCDLDVRVPEAQGVKVRVSVGPIELKGLAGHADLETGVGSMTVSSHAGKVDAKVATGTIHLAKIEGDVGVVNNIGQIKVEEASGAVTAKSGVGKLEITGVRGDVAASNDIGEISIESEAAVTAKTGNGRVSVRGAKGKIQATSALGQVKLEQVAGPVEAESANGSVSYTPAAESAVPFRLKSKLGAIHARLPASATGTIDADTRLGKVTVSGSRQPRSSTGSANSKKIVLTESGPTSELHTDNGSITIRLD